MKPSPYLKRVLRELDSDLRRLSRQEKLKYLYAYKSGLESAFHYCYPDRFPLISVSEISERHTPAFEQGAYVAEQFKQLEVSFAREFLLVEVGKRKIKFSNPGALEQLYELFGRSSERV